MYTHVCIAADDIAASKAFYDAVLAPLGVTSQGQLNPRTCAYTSGQGTLLVMTPADGNSATHSNGGTIGFAAPDAVAVDAFHAAGLVAGGTDAGAPGKRPNAPGNAYGAYLRDPVGNKICAYCQLPN